MEIQCIAYHKIVNGKTYKIIDWIQQKCWNFFILLVTYFFEQFQKTLLQYLQEFKNLETALIGKPKIIEIIIYTGNFGFVVNTTELISIICLI